MSTFISTDGIDKIQDKLDALKKKVDIEELLKVVAPIVQEDIEFRFKTAPSVEQGGKVHGGVTWKKLSNYTIKLGNRAGGKILINTGELMRSATMQGHPYNVARIEDDSLIFGTKLPYANTHQPEDLLTTVASLAQLDNIDNHKRGEVAVRPFIFFHEQLVTKVVDGLQEVVSNAK